jgi:NADPH:quinone reductase-like Zn-dependent oxidoreductase
MKGLIVTKIGGDYELVNDLEKPSPGKGQILVKSIATGINPVYAIRFAEAVNSTTNSNSQ